MRWMLCTLLCLLLLQPVFALGKGAFNSSDHQFAPQSQITDNMPSPGGDEPQHTLSFIPSQLDGPCPDATIAPLSAHRGIRLLALRQARGPPHSFFV